MSTPQPPLPAGRTRLSLSGIVTGGLGLALLVWVVRYVGLSEVLADVRLVGWGLAAIIVLGGLRFLLRAIAWRLCLEPPHRLGLAHAFAAVVCGDAIGNLTPLGPLVGEPAKAAYVRGQVALGPAATSLAIENILYSLSAAAMIASGTVALLIRFRVPLAYARAGQIAIGAIVVMFAAALWLLWRQPALLSRALGLAPPLRKHTGRLRDIESQIYTFASRHPAALPGLAGAELGFHVLGVAEVYLTLWLLKRADASLLNAFILESVNRLITAVFKFIPLRLGVDEAGTALYTEVLGLGANTGVVLAIVRKARTVFWMVVGGVLLVRRGGKGAGGKQ